MRRGPLKGWHDVHVPKPPQPGLAWYVVCDLGFAVGLVSHYAPRLGHLVWIAAPVFNGEPTTDDVRLIDAWRWPVLFPLGAAIHRRIATPIGIVPIPHPLQAWPVVRSRAGKSNGSNRWMAASLSEAGTVPIGETKDRSLPIYRIVNDTRLREMIVSGWMPADEW